MRLYMIRHGQTVANAQKIYYTDEPNAELTDKGRDQARAIAPIMARIPFDVVYSSDYIRAIETQRLAMPGVEGIRTPLLREIYPGTVLGGKPHTYVREHPEIFGDWTPAKDQRGYKPVGGEDMDDVNVRLREFLSILEKDPKDNVAAFVHNGILGCMLRLVLGATDFKRNAVASSNCAIHVFEYDGTMWKLLAWNYMVPLNGEEIL